MTFHLPGKRLFVERRERRGSVFLVVVEARLDADDLERLESLTYGFHVLLLSNGGASAPHRVGDESRMIT